MTATKSWVKAIAGAALVVSAGAGIFAAAGASNPPAVRAPVAGGYRNVAVTDPAVRGAAQFGVAQLRRARARLAGIDAAQQQVVAGMNYRIDVTLTDRSRWRLSIYRPLRGPMQARRAERILPAGQRG
jgi:Cystatin domain